MKEIVKSMKQVIVTGGRDYRDWNMISDVLDLIKPDTVIQGGASGADHLALEWAITNMAGYFTYVADWNKYGRAAGPIRNREMLREHPDALVIAFPGGKGTENCVSIARELHRTVLRVS